MLWSTSVPLPSASASERKQPSHNKQSTSHNKQSTSQTNNQQVITINQTCINITILKTSYVTLEAKPSVAF